jgi:hypothetical protein
MNESLLLETNLEKQDTLFLIDTGYAGPPVISSSYLAIEDSSGLPLNERYARITRRLAKGVDSNARHRAIDSFLRRRGCVAYTSGCTMRLMGIGDVQEQQADMLLCGPLRIRSIDGTMAAPMTRVDANVFVTNPLPTSVHILTCDYLVHASPTLIDIGNGVLKLSLSQTEAVAQRATMSMHPIDMSGGAFVVPIRLGGVVFRVTVDTGAPGPVSLGRSAGARMKSCMREKKALHQEGVNGERVCSEITRTDMSFAGNMVNDVPVFVNDTEVEGVDGYVGMGVLRAFNILILPDGIGFAPNGNPIRSADTYAASTDGDGCNIQLSC